jgi:signal transduction histidine kinase
MLSIVLQIFGFLFIALRLRTVTRKSYSILEYLVGIVGTSAIILFSFKLSGYSIAWHSMLFFIAIIVIPVLVSFENLRKYKSTFLVLFSLLVALYFNSFLYRQLEKRNTETQKLLATNLASERDPAAEIFISEFELEIRKDTVITDFLIPPYDVFEEYLNRNYFGGFWRDFDVQVTVCGYEDSIIVQPEERLYDCNSFFTSKQKMSGSIIPGTNFYFIDELDGHISYLGIMQFQGTLDGDSLSVYIDIKSKPIPEGQGYPELLLDESVSGKTRLNGFCYAKYHKNQLVDRSGRYQYELSLIIEKDQEQEFSFFTKNNYVHCGYSAAPDNYIIVSTRLLSFSDRLESFPYLFLIIYLIGLLFMGVNTRALQLRRTQWDFRKRIQFSLVSLLLGALLIVGGGVITYNYIQFKNNIKNGLNEKMRSVSAELGMIMDDEIELNNDWVNSLDYELIQLSDIYWVDINLFTTTGELFATSRYDIYNRGLTSQRMNPYAFNAMSVEGDLHYLHYENLGSMTFYSAYVPVYNSANKLLGFLNIPYITKQSELGEEISGYIVVFLNLYILLSFISVIIAVFISNGLTAPLRIVEEGLRGIQFGESNAKIEYYSDDEIGRLVNEYNKKVDELRESAKLLARSERESAWREMARQVAHEIKNPLTPMRLSIQYLQRLKDKETEHFDIYFKEVTGTLIEQVETLSSIASAFSDFATMPKTKNEKIDLCERIKEVVTLFETTDNVKIEFKNATANPVYVKADKDQIKRAFINIIKNSIQSIPSEYEGEIIIGLKLSPNSVLISFKDNGTGIDDELKDKLFEPNFTTKTSGMGLGLAITKNIVETSGGKICFDTIPGNGTVFYVELPIYKDYID